MCHTHTCQLLRLGPYYYDLSFKNMTVQPEVTKYTLAVFFQLRKKEKQGDLDDAQEITTSELI